MNYRIEIQKVSNGGGVNNRKDYDKQTTTRDT